MSKNYNPKIHHRQSMRLKDYDYSQDGYYFVTICAKNKVEYFGEIQNGKMILNEYGEIVANEWIETKNIRKNVKLDEFIVMPNHIHGIVIIDNNNCRGVLQYAPTALHAFQSPSNNLGAVVRGFKSAVTKQINQIQVRVYCNTPLSFQWQKSFYDHIVRNEKSLSKIREYIRNNPLKWELDRNNPENLFM